MILSLAFAYGCPSIPCGTDKISVTSGGVCTCVSRQDFTDVTVEVTPILEWDVVGTHMGQYQVQIRNQRGSTAAKVILLEVIENSYQITREEAIPRIARNSAYTYGVTSIGKDAPKILLDSVTF
ncbi:hypothetical protein ACTFIR_000170 [Dictyostelium discoideum]